VTHPSCDLCPPFLPSNINEEGENESAVNTSLEMAFSTVGKVVFYDCLGAFFQFLLCRVDELLRSGIPSLHDGANIILLDDKREIVG
jgi:hypothetical protein